MGQTIHKDWDINENRNTGSVRSGKYRLDSGSITLRIFNAENLS